MIGYFIYLGRESDTVHWGEDLILRIGGELKVSQYASLSMQ